MRRPNERRELKSDRLHSARLCHLVPSLSSLPLSEPNKFGSGALFSVCSLPPPFFFSFSRGPILPVNSRPFSLPQIGKSGTRKGREGKGQEGGRTDENEMPRRQRLPRKKEKINRAQAGRVQCMGTEREAVAKTHPPQGLQLHRRPRRVS